MQDEDEFEFEIYHNGVHFTAPVRGKAQFLAERAFLDELVGARYAAHLLPRPVPDPPGDFYTLNDVQLEAYSEFRRARRLET